MKVDFAFVCDYAEVTGKINALGIGFDVIYSPKVPCKHSLFFLVIQMRASVVETGEKSLEVRLIDDDGVDVIPTLRTRFAVPRPISGTESVARIAMAFNNIEFRKYGSYSLHTVVEGNEMVSVPLRVSPPPQAA